MNLSNEIKLCFEACVLIEEDILVCCAYNMNLIFTINIITNEIKVLGSIPEEPFFKRQLIGNIQYWNGKLFFVPLTASKIWSYTLENQSWKSISLGKNIEENIKFKFSGAFIKEDILYMLGYQYFGIVKINLNDRNQLTFIPGDDWESSTNEFIWGKSFVQMENKIYMASCSNKLIVFDLLQENYEYINVGLSDERFVGVCHYKGDLWIAPLIYTSDILIYGKERIKVKKFLKKYSTYESICICGNEVLINGYTENSIKINMDKIPYTPELVQEKIYYNNYVNNKFVIRSGYGYIDVYSVAEKKWNRLTCQIKNKLFKENVKQTFDNNFMQENELDNLNLFITAVCG